MVKIRLTRMGDIRCPIYRVVVTDGRKPRSSDYIDLLGVYHPKETTGQTKLDVEKAKSWLAKGAQPTDTARGLLVKFGAMEAKPVPAKTPKKKAEAK